MNIEDKNGATVLRRTAEYKPGASIRNWLIGRPLPTADAPHQTIGKTIGLAVFSSDALSSVAYGPQEMLMILAVAGIGSLRYAVPLSFAIVLLLAILVFSYEQTIHAYPDGGGSYIVARDNLGDLYAETAGAALLTDYILTVAVSISSGVAQVVSAYPVLYPYRTILAVGMVLFIMVVNLRGVKESGLAFSLPTYLFIIMMYVTIGYGFFQLFTGTLGTVVAPPMEHIPNIVQPVTILLILRAFSNGTSALTGVEAISNGITAFKEPRSKNAGKTLIWMGVILGTLMLGITYLNFVVGGLPSEEETIISQMARTIYQGRGFIYLVTIFSTMVILMMAANTAFADFPRLSAIAAADGFLPRQLTYRGSRLVYSRGIVALALIASGLIVIFQASVTKLIPLYAIGVFLSFTLSQAGMARRWYKSGRLRPDEEVKEPGSILRFDKGWQYKMLINGFGALTTLVVTLVFAITKFKEGAYVVVILTPLLVIIFSSIHRHYKKLAGKLSMENFGTPPRISNQRVIMPLSGVHRGTLAALRFARTLSDDITAVHVSIDPKEAARVQQKWERWGEGYRLVILDSPYRLFIEPLLEYIEEIDRHRQPNEVLTILVPQFVTRNTVSDLLHTRTADTLRKVLLYKKDLVIIEVPYQVD